MPFTPLPNLLQLTPANPTGTASATLVMMGLGVAGAVLTPKSTGRIVIFASGSSTNNTTSDGLGVQLSYGTGAAPANGAAVTGTQVGGLVTTSQSAVVIMPFGLNAIVTDLVIGTQVWVDIALKAVTGGTASLTTLSLSVLEF